MNYNEYLSLVKNRRSVRRFTDEPVTDEQLMQICDAAHYAMSGGNSQPWEFLIIRNPETIQKLREEYLEHEFRWTYWLEQQRMPEYRHRVFNFPHEELEERTEQVGWQITAPAVICLLYDPRKQFGSVLSARAEMDDGSMSVISCTMGHLNMCLQLAVSSLGLASSRMDCNQQEGYRRILGYPEPVRLYCMVPVGHPAMEYGEGRRHPVQELIHYERYDEDKVLQEDEILTYIRKLRNR